MAMLYAALAQVLWTLIVIILAGRARLGALQAREVKISQIALSNDPWPARARAFGNNMNNQFETPILFYVLVGAAIHLNTTGWIMTALAWGYVATRIAHTLVHTGSNNVVVRFRIFVAGVFILLALWIGVVARLAGLA